LADEALEKAVSSVQVPVENEIRIEYDSKNSLTIQLKSKHLQNPTVRRKECAFNDKPLQISNGRSVAQKSSARFDSVPLAVMEVMLHELLRVSYSASYKRVGSLVYE
jgi:hypothetical protein